MTAMERITALEARIAQLEARIARLEAPTPYPGTYSPPMPWRWEPPETGRPPPTVTTYTLPWMNDG